MQLSKLRARTSTRKLAGVSIPRQDRTSGAFKKASAAAGHAPDAGVADGSSSARMRTDRPGRARGGRVGREDGGSTISEDSKREAAKQRDTARHKNIMYGLSGAAAIGSGALAAASKFGRAGNAGLAGFNALMAKDSRDQREAATKEADRIEKGQVKPGEEDRKSGGAVKKKG